MDTISQSFPTATVQISHVFGSTIGFVIPPYQREYNWDENNVEQLIDDITEGINFLLQNSENEIHYLGTMICVEGYAIDFNDRRAKPTRVDGIIDGQQRITSIALIGTILYKRILSLSQELGDDDDFDEFKKWLNDYLQEDLTPLFTVYVRSGQPPLKPKLVRELDDEWTYSGSEEHHYKSDLSKYLSDVIIWMQRDSDSTRFPTPIGNDANIAENLKTMQKLLKAVEQSHSSYISDENVMPPAWEIISKIESLVWQFQRPKLNQIILNARDKLLLNQQIENDERVLCEIAQLLAFSYYLTKRCYLTTIYPTSLDWAFDMFQSLNATGTPLTAIETFKPEVVKVTDEYSKSTEREYFDVIDHYMNSASNADRKAKLTNELLTTFAWAYEGKKLSRWLSVQRKWLQTTYRSLGDESENVTKTNFVAFLSNVAKYYQHKDELDRQSIYLPLLKTLEHRERELATLAVIFLEASNHTMSRTVLSRFYSNILQEVDGAVEEFVEAAKAVAAFFVLWRSIRTNSGLPEVYKHILRGHEHRGYKALSWTGEQEAFTSTNLKEYLHSELMRKAKSKEEWKAKAPNYLRYDRAKTVCKFALLIVSQDTISDPNNKGLIKVANRKDETRNYLTPRMWFSPTTKTLEHVAPQSQNSQWDQDLYTDEMYQSIGNLTLLPENINQILGNHSWQRKWSYFDSVTTRDETGTMQFEAKYGFKPKNKVLDILKQANYIDYLKPIVSVGREGKWDRGLVKKRTENIAELLWNQLILWLR